MKIRLTDRQARLVSFACLRMINDGYARLEFACQKGSTVPLLEVAALEEDIKELERIRSILV